MTMRARALMVGILLLAAPAFAADVDVRWTGSMSTPMGEVPVTFVFKAEGETLTGALIGMDGVDVPIANGKIDGNKIAYTVTVDFGGMTLELIYRGVVSATEINLDMEVFGMPFNLVVRKTN